MDRSSCLSQAFKRKLEEPSQIGHILELAQRIGVIFMIEGLDDDIVRRIVGSQRGKAEKMIEDTIGNIEGASYGNETDDSTKERKNESR